MASPYVELHAHSYYSLLNGASTPEALVQQASLLGMDALALTDHDAVYGAVDFSRAAQVLNVKPIFGAELTLAGGHHLTLLVKNQIGWANLCSLITVARHNAPKGEAELPKGVLQNHTKGLIALSGCAQGAIPGALLRGQKETARKAASILRELFDPDNFWIELQHHLLPEDSRLVRELVGLARELGLGYVATNNVHYATRDRSRLQDVLTCIRHLTSLDEAGKLLRSNDEWHLKTGEQLAYLFPDYPEALANSQRIAERCHFELEFGLQDLPQFPTPNNRDASSYLRELCLAALTRRYPDAPFTVKAQLEHELAVIEKAGLANYFLLVWDIIRFARENGILCQGRGSAANSLVAYLLDITPIDPLRYDLVFERFLTPERASSVDIDIDFQGDRREEVIQYVFEKYGLEHAAMAATFITFRARSAIRDVGKALGFPLSVLDKASKTIDYRDMSSEGVVNSPGFQEAFGHQFGALPWQHLIELTGQIKGFPRHLGIHNGGMILMGPPLAQRLPTEPATMQDRYVTQWDKYGLDGAGIIKLDILGLRMLSVIAEAVAVIEETTGQRPDMNRLSFDDPAIFDMINRAETVGIFQIESRAQAQLQPRLKARTFEDLIISVAIIRPGPIQGNMVHPYLNRRNGKEPVTYVHPSLKPALAETLGVILYQEQVLKVARDFAGFSPGQGELLRRAMGSKNAPEEIESFHDAFIEGAMRRSISRDIAEEVFNSLRAFGGYSFAKSHAAAFAVIVYQSAWLKYYFPAELFSGWLNHQPMGFWGRGVLVDEAKKYGVKVLDVDVNHSTSKCRAENSRIRLGFEQVDGFGEVSAARIEEARGDRSFVDLVDFCKRTKLPRRLVENLILLGAMDAWGVPRRNLVWELGKLQYQEEELDLVFAEDDVALPSLSRQELLELDYSLQRYSIHDHPIALFRPWLDEQNILTTSQFATRKHGDVVRVAGMIIMHQAPPTAKGMHFITLQDEDGMLDLVVTPDVYKRFRNVIRGSPLLIAEGMVEHNDGSVALLAKRAATMPRLAQASPELVEVA